MANNKFLRVETKKVDYKESRWTEGVCSITLFGEKKSPQGHHGVLSCLTKFGPNTDYPIFKLLGIIEFFILDGSIRINGILCESGDYIRIESGEVKMRAGEDGCEILCLFKNGYLILEQGDNEDSKGSLGGIYRFPTKEAEWRKSKYAGTEIRYKGCWRENNIWEGDDDPVAFSCVTEFAPGISYPQFELLGPVEYFVIEGSIDINNEVCKIGDYVRIESGEVIGKTLERECKVICFYHNGLHVV